MTNMKGFILAGLTVLALSSGAMAQTVGFEQSSVDQAAPAQGGVKGTGAGHTFRAIEDWAARHAANPPAEDYTEVGGG